MGAAGSADEEARANRPWRWRAPWQFDAESAARALAEQFRTHDLRGFGCADKPAAIAAAGALLAYVRETQKAALPHLLSITTEERDAALIMDPATRRNLELDESLAGRPELTLAGVFDRTATAMGGRLLRRWLHRPLRDHGTLRLRYHAVATLIEAARHEGLAQALRSIGDLERILARVALRSARPRDLAQLRTALGALPALHRSLGEALDPQASPSFASWPASWRTTAPSTRCWRAPSSNRRRITCATAASSRKATTPNSTSCACSAAAPSSSCSIWSAASASAPACPA